MRRMTRRARTCGVLVVVGLSFVAGPGPQGGSATRKAAVTSDQVVEDAIAFVEKERGLRFRSRPRVQVLGESAFLKRLDTTRRSDPHFERDLAAFSALLRAMGMVKGPGDPRTLLDTFFAGAVGGFYDVRTGDLVIRSGDIGPAARAIIVHELTHALDDQHFGLDRPQLDERSDDSAAAFQYLAEGSARYVENRYRATFTRQERDQAAIEEAGMGNQEEMFRIVTDPSYSAAVPFLFTSLLAPYEVGKQFVGDLVRRRGLSGLDAAFRDPPATTEQVVEVDRYLAREPARPVPAPEIPAGATVVDQGVVGLGSLDALLATRETFTDIERTDPAALGWGGDAYVVWRAGGRQCVRMDFVMDTPTDRRELRAALVRLAGSMPSARVEDRPGEVTRLTSCG